MTQDLLREAGETLACLKRPYGVVVIAFKIDRIPVDLSPALVEGDEDCCFVRTGSPSLPECRACLEASVRSWIGVLILAFDAVIITKKIFGKEEKPEIGKRLEADARPVAYPIAPKVIIDVLKGADLGVGKELGAVHTHQTEPVLHVEEAHHIVVLVGLVDALEVHLPPVRIDDRFLAQDKVGEGIGLK